MSEELKCPVCGGEMVLYEEHMDGSDTIACMECAFACAERDLPKVSAAMDLAKLTVQMKTCRAYCPERAYLFAQDRVLEVLNG